MGEPGRDSLPIVAFLLGIAAGFGGFLLADLDAGHAHSAASHAPHQLLLAAPLALLGAIVLRAREPRDFWGALGLSVLGLVAANALLALGA